MAARTLLTVGLAVLPLASQPGLRLGYPSPEAIRTLDHRKRADPIQRRFGVMTSNRTEPPVVRQGDCGFGGFVPTAGTRAAFALARALATRQAGAPRVLLLHGPTSVGKTHLLRAVLRQGQRERPSTVVAHAVGIDIVDRLVAAVRHGRGGAGSAGWKGADFIALDDLQVLTGRPRTQDELARLLREAVAAGSRVICAAGGSLQPLEALVAGLAQSPGMVASALGRPSTRELVRILRGLADRRTLRPGPID